MAKSIQYLDPSGGGRTKVVTRAPGVPPPTSTSGTPQPSPAAPLTVGGDGGGGEDQNHGRSRGNGGGGNSWEQPDSNPLPPGERGRPIPPAGGPGANSNGGPVSIYGGPDAFSKGSVAQQTAQNNVGGQTPFWQTPGLMIAGQRASGADVQNDPAISAYLQDFQRRIQPQMQDVAGKMGLGRSSTTLNAIAQAEQAGLAPMYESAFGREENRIGRLGQAAESELGRQERSSQRVADANQNMAQLLMQLSNQRYGQQAGAGQAQMSAGDVFRQIAQQGNTAELNDFLRRQSLGENAVNAPFGGLAGGMLGSMTSSTGK